MSVMVPGRLLSALSTHMVSDFRELSRSDRRRYSFVRSAAPNVFDDPRTPPASRLAAIASLVAVSIVLLFQPSISAVLRTVCVSARLALCVSSIGTALIFRELIQRLNETAFGTPLFVSHEGHLPQRKTHSLRLLHKSPNHAGAPQVGTESVTDMRLLSNYLHGFASPSIPRNRLMFNCPSGEASRWN